jgi:hypothetical protein
VNNAIPTTSIILIYILAAVLPAAILMAYIYRKDKIEKEPADCCSRCCFWASRRRSFRSCWNLWA